VLYCPPLWFLGIYQRVLEGPAGLPIYTRLAQTGCAALLITVAVAALAYPVAYIRRVRQLVVGPGTHDTRSWTGRPLYGFLHSTLLRPPVSRAVFHFISQTLLRVPRYRIYLVLYGGAGLSVVVASILACRSRTARFARKSLPMAFARLSASSPSGSSPDCAWRSSRLAINREAGFFRIVHGRPPHRTSAMHQLRAAKVWVLLWSAIVTFGAWFAFRAIVPPAASHLACNSKPVAHRRWHVPAAHRHTLPERQDRRLYW